MFEALAPWKKQTLLFLTSQTLSLFGSALTQHAIIWYITLTTTSGSMLMLSTVCGFAPQILISLFAGVWIDRYERKRLIMLADSAIGLSTLGLALMYWSGHGSIWMLLGALIIRSAGTGIQVPAVNAVLPQIVPSEQLMRVNGINSTLSSLMMFLAPAAGGFVLSVSTIETAFMVDVITAGVGVGIMSIIAIQPHVKAANTSASCMAQIKEGFAYLRAHPLLRRLLLFQLTVLFLISPSAFLTPLLVARTFGSEVWRLSIGEMTYSLGAVSGGLLIAAWGGLRSRVHTVLLAGCGYGCLMIAMGCSTTFAIYLLFNMLIGVTSPCYSSPLTVMIQETIEPDMHGRVFSFLQIASACAFPLGMVLFGPLADTMRVQTLLISNGAAVLCCVACFWCTLRK